MKKGVFLAVFAVIAVLIAYSAGAQMLSRVDPGRGQPGERVDVSGRDLDRCDAGMLTIYFPEQNVYLDLIDVRWSSTNITCYIPGLEATGWTREQKNFFYNHATYGEMKIVNIEGTSRSNCSRGSAYRFKFVPPPPSFFFVSVSGPGDFRVGETFNIEGTGFGETPGKVVYPKSVEGEIVYPEFPIERWSKTFITVRIPTDIKTGVEHQISVLRDDGDGLFTSSNSKAMNFQPLEIRTAPMREFTLPPGKTIRPHPPMEPARPGF